MRSCADDGSLHCHQQKEGDDGYTLQESHKSHSSDVEILPKRGQNVPFTTLSKS